MSPEVKDETPIAAAFLTGVLQVVFLAMFYALFTAEVGLPNAFWIALFFTSIVVAAAVYYLTTKKVGAIILYSFAISIIMILIAAFFGSIMDYSPTVSGLGLLTLLLVFSGALSSLIGTVVTGKFEPGFLSVFERRKKRRSLRE